MCANSAMIARYASAHLWHQRRMGRHALIAQHVSLIVVPDPRYRPRDYLKHPRTFGLTQTPQLLPTSGIEERAKSRASYGQAVRAHQIRLLMAEFQITALTLAESVELKPAKVSRILNGEIRLSVEDSARFAIHFDELRAAAEPDEDFS